MAQVVLLLSFDPALERELTSLLGEGSLLSVSSPAEVSETLCHLDGSPVLLMDTLCFSPADCPDIPTVICVGEDITPGYPLLERPVREKELRALLLAASSSRQDGGTSGDTPLPSPFDQFQRDAVHDIKNQLTTLQGNLILLEEDLEPEVMQDMTHAAEAALAHVEWLGLLAVKEDSTESVSLRTLLEELLPFFYRIRQRKCTFTLAPEAPDALVHTDPKHVLVLLLTLVHHLPGHVTRCRLDLKAQPPRITCHWEPETEQMICPESVSRRTATLGCQLTPSPHSWELTFPGR